MVAQSVFGVVIAGGNLVFWWLALTRVQARFRRWCERRFGVTITTAHRGFWSVQGERPATTRFAIELLQLGFVIALFAVWSVAVLVAVVVSQRLGPRA